MRRVVFVFDPDWPEVGSTVMRGQQLSELASERLGRGWRVRYVPLGTDIARSDVFLTKNAARRLDAEGAARLVARRNRLFVDIVDSAAPEWVREVPCTIVSSSYTSQLVEARELPEREVVLVNHHTDPRIPERTGPFERFRVAYVGEPFNAFLPPTVAERVEVLPVSTAEQDPSWVPLVGEFPLHYALRTRMAQDDVKPFLKGFTAAVCGANIVASAKDPEARAWLGDDYPYLVPRTTQDAALEVLDRARSDYGTARWDAALDTMRGIAQRVTPDRIVAELRRALSR